MSRYVQQIRMQIHYANFCQQRHTNNESTESEQKDIHSVHPHIHASVHASILRCIYLYLLRLRRWLVEGWWCAGWTDEEENKSLQQSLLPAGCFRTDAASALETSAGRLSSSRLVYKALGVMKYGCGPEQFLPGLAETGPAAGRLPDRGDVSVESLRPERSSAPMLSWTSSSGETQILNGFIKASSGLPADFRPEAGTSSFRFGVSFWSFNSSLGSTFFGSWSAEGVSSDGFRPEGMTVSLSSRLANNALSSRSKTALGNQFLMDRSTSSPDSTPLTGCAGIGVEQQNSAGLLESNTVSSVNGSSTFSSISLISLISLTSLTFSTATSSGSGLTFIRFRRLVGVFVLDAFWLDDQPPRLP